MTEFLDAIETILRKADRASQLGVHDIRNLKAHLKNTAAYYQLTHDQTIQTEHALTGLQNYATSRQADPINILQDCDNALKAKAWEALESLRDLFKNAEPSALARSLRLA